MMHRLEFRCLVFAAAALLAAPAHAVSFPLGLDITSVAAGNPFGAVVGTVFTPGDVANTGSAVITGVGTESVPANTGADASADLRLTVGSVVFTDEDEIEFAAGDVPSVELQDGVFVGLDFVVLFGISGSDAVGVPFDPTDLTQDTSGFTDGDDYWADFFGDGSFTIGLVTAFAQVFDPEDNANVLEPVFGQGFAVEGTVLVPEPSTGLLLGMGLLGLARARRR